MIGPPPRAWGRQVDPYELPRERRSTPTRVGTTTTRASATPSRTVHPHARGDDKARRRAWSSATGPPPRAWGRLGLGPVADRDLRSTPTRVGTTRCRCARRCAPTVHPHARGDDWR